MTAAAWTAPLDAVERSRLIALLDRASNRFLSYCADQAVYLEMRGLRADVHAESMAAWRKEFAR